jgi:antitoxin CptB
MATENRAGEDISIRRRRLQYRAAHRGTRELDMLLGPYAVAHIGTMTEPELDSFERLLTEAETDLQAWLLSQAEPPLPVRALIARIVVFKQNRIP